MSICFTTKISYLFQKRNVESKIRSWAKCRIESRLAKFRIEILLESEFSNRFFVSFFETKVAERIVESTSCFIFRFEIRFTSEVSTSFYENVVTLFYESVDTFIIYESVNTSIIYECVDRFIKETDNLLINTIMNGLLEDIHMFGTLFSLESL